MTTTTRSNHQSSRRGCGHASSNNVAGFFTRRAVTTAAGASSSNAEGVMKFSDVFGTTYWHADLLAGRAVQLTIAAIEMEYLEDGQEAVPVVYFAEDQKGLRLGRRNAATLQEAFGDDMRHSVGKQVLLRAEGAGQYAWVKLTPVIESRTKRTAKRRAR